VVGLSRLDNHQYGGNAQDAVLFTFANSSEDGRWRLLDILLGLSRSERESIEGKDTPQYIGTFAAVAKAGIMSSGRISASTRDVVRANRDYLLSGVTRNLATDQCLDAIYAMYLKDDINPSVYMEFIKKQMDKPAMVDTVCRVLSSPFEPKSGYTPGPVAKRQVIGFLADNFDKIMDGALPGNSPGQDIGDMIPCPFGRISALGALAEYANPPVSTEAAQAIKMGLETSWGPHFMSKVTTYATPKMIGAGDIDEGHWAVKHMEDMVFDGVQPGEHRLPLKRCVRDWVASNSRQSQESTVTCNAQVVGILARTDPQIAVRQHEDFGISCFARLNPDFHIRQDAQRADRESDWIWIPFEMHDPTGAFYSSVGYIRELSDDLDKRGVLSRVSEYSSARDILTRYLMLTSPTTKRHPECKGYKPPRIIVFQSHGQMDYLASASSAEFGISVDAIEKRLKADSGLRELPKDTIIVFHSCHVGKPEGLAQRVSRRFGVTVVCSDQACLVDGMKVDVDEDGLHPKVRFKDIEGKVIPTIVYKEGIRADATAYTLEKKA
jgi:hypothetical protein